MGKRLNRDEKRARQAAELATFMQQYARKAQPGIGPNDRQYDRDVEKAMKRLPPAELDRLLREDEDDT